MRRTVLIASWTALSCVAWMVLAAGLFRGVALFEPKLFSRFVSAGPPVLFLTGIFLIGPLVVMATVAAMGLAGRLPGTSRRYADGSPVAAFPVIQKQGPDSDSAAVGR